MLNILIDKNADGMQKNLMITFVAETLFMWFKILPFLRYGEKIKRCINFFGHEDFAHKDYEERKITNECIRICRRNSTAYFYGIIATELVWNVPVLISKERKLPMYPWLPYDPLSTSLVYYVTLVYTTAGM
ncbi:hypothetical protein Zmor_010300 [Zophobas morio]|uniref:Uncharacterized protein n=1 Tax=Zophobas morio TaxID=2755281 RepID=A0AA38MJU6_9CUCU|nr:hypothetical protein Zmor_010300 [Zophobas morio]